MRRQTSHASPQTETACAVFDVGKTFAKVSVVTSGGLVLREVRLRTPTFTTALYSALDVDRIFEWLLQNLQTLAKTYCIDRIIPVAHGAACAFLDENHALVQPIQDYEGLIPARAARDYARIRPTFDETLSPRLPRGLNLGAQIHWHAHRDPALFSRVRHILTYPQYWAWRLSGALASEVTSLGCHTDLWAPATATFSSLVGDGGWQSRFPKMHNAWDTAGVLRPQIVRATGLRADTRVCVGLHDTNAALAALLKSPIAQRSTPALLSTGTWFIAMAPGGLMDASVGALQAERDCMGAVDVFGNTVPCARFMGGRAFDLITRGQPLTEVDASTLSGVMRDAALAMPSFLDAGGPFPGLRGEIRGLQNDTPQTRAALGLLYQALVSTTCLGLIQAGQTLMIEGAAAGNPTLCGLIAALHDGPVLVNTAASGVTLGAAAVAYHGEAAAPSLRHRRVKPLLLDEMRAYQRLWTAAVNEAVAA